MNLYATRRILFENLHVDKLRKYASRIQLRNAGGLRGGKFALVEALLNHEMNLGLDHPLVRQYSYVIGVEREDFRISSLKEYDLSTPDSNLSEFLKGIESWPKKILQAEIEYTLKYDQPLPGWSDLDLLRYTMRFYPHRRIYLVGRHKSLPAAVRRLLTKDPVSQVRSAALGITWENATCVQ
jgi:hypothetical protein